MKKLSHQLVLGLLSALFVTVSLGWFVPASSSYMRQDSSFIELHLDSGSTATVSDESGKKLDIKSGDRLLATYQITSGNVNGVSISFPGGTFARLSPSTKLTLLSASSQSPYSLLLTEGEAWINAAGSTHSLVVYVPQGAMATSDNNAFNVVSRDGELNIFAAKNPVRTALFLPKSSDVSTSTSFSPDDVHPLNSILVTEGNQLDVLLSKIQPKLEKLLYSKLVKEFRYQPLTDAEIKKNLWFQFNYQLDAHYRDTALAQLIAMVKDRGVMNPDPSNPLSIFYSSYHSFRNTLTLDQKVRQQNTMTHALSYLDDSIYFFSVSQTGAAKERMDYFMSIVASYSKDGDFVREIDDALWDRFQRFSLLVPQDGSLYALKTDLISTLLRLNQSGYHISFDRASRLTQSSLYDVYSALNFDAVVTNQLLKEHIDRMSQLFALYSADISKSPQVLAEENQLLSQLYLRSPLFYKESYFSQKFAIESKWLAILPDGVDKQEENQTLIAAKIDLMKKLRSYFFADKLELADARAVMFLLLSNITAVTDSSSDVAAVQLFRNAVKLQQSFWKFLNSSEFADSSVHGQTNKDRFVAFSKNAESQKEIDTLQNGLLGASSVSVEESRQTLLDVQKTFAKIGVKKLVVGPLLDKDQKQVVITSAEYQGIPFSAIYDRDSTLISDVKVYNDIVLSSSIPLSQLKNIFKPNKANDTSSTLALADDVGSIGSALTGSFNEGAVEKVAKLFIVKKFTDLGFTLTLDSVSTVNYQTKLFQLKSVTLPFDKNPIILSFSLDLKSNNVSKISLFVLGSAHVVPGEFPIDDLADQVKTEYESAFYQKIDQDLGGGSSLPQ